MNTNLITKVIEFHHVFLFLIIFHFISRPILVFLHEIGHAIPALLITKEKVSIYIGSYGDSSKSLKFNIGLLEIWFKYLPSYRKGGVCIATGKIVSINKQILYTVSGSLTAFIIPLIVCYLTFLFDSSGVMKFVTASLLGFATIDLFINLIPSTRQIKLDDGRVTFNDGQLIKLLLSYKKLPEEYAIAANLYNEKEFAEAGKVIDRIIQKEFKVGNVYKLGISCAIQIQYYEKAKSLLDEFILLDTMDADDFSNAGFIYSKLGSHEKAIEFYDISLDKNPKHLYSINNKGYTFILVNRFEEAITLFDRAIEIDEKFYYSYSNRGLSKIKLGKIDEGLKDLNDSLEIEANNSYAYRNIGIYHLDRGDKEKALEFFIKAKELDPITDLIDELIVEASKQ